MRTSKTAYKSLRHTIDMMSRQVADSIEFANDFLPARTTCQEIWYILKDNLSYRNDPPGIELLQSFPSLMEDNYWGIPGAGDCDCFTIAALACARARGIPARAVIVGNSSQAPTHIYCQLFDGSKFIDFDLVSSSYGTTKAYKNKQIIKLH